MFRALEKRLLSAKTVRISSRIQMTGAMEATLEGTLLTQRDNFVNLHFNGDFSGQPAFASRISDGVSMKSTTRHKSFTDKAPDRLRRSVLEMQESFNVIERSSVPVLAAVQGACVGGGVDLVSACDMRYCTADAFFVIQEINIGMVADVGTLQRLPHLIPAGLVRELAYTGRRLEAEEARRAGLVNRVFDDRAAMLEGVLEIAREIAARSPLAVRGSKEMLNFTRDHTVAEGLNYIATWQAGMLLSDDFGEAAAAHAEKREPEFDDILPAAGIVKRR